MEGEEMIRDDGFSQNQDGDGIDGIECSIF